MMIKTLTLLGRFFVCLFCLTTSLSAADRVHVDVINGAPQIVVDGQPVRARMFFGNPGSRPINLVAGPQQISYEFIAIETEEKNATMHFRFDKKPTEIVIDNIVVEELSDDGSTTGRNVFGPDTFENGMSDFERDWLHWPIGSANTVGSIDVKPGVGCDGSNGLAVKLSTPPTGEWCDFHFFHKANLSLTQSKKYRVSFWIFCNVETTAQIAFYRPGPNYVLLGVGSDFFTSQIKYAGQAGARFVSFSLPPYWPRPGEAPDWKDIDTSCQRVLDANPDALLIPRVGMDPPEWWMEENPSEVITWKGTPFELRKVAAVASRKYREEAARHLEALVEHLEERFGPSMGGYHPCGQNTGEWFYQDTWGPALNGYSQSDAVAWKDWLVHRYHNDATLQVAWGDMNVTLARAEVPSPELRRSKSGGVFRDRAVEKAVQAVNDFSLFQQEQMADTVLAFAHSVRKASMGQRLVVFFYGYIFEFGAVMAGPATSGHYALNRVLQSPDIDILCSPISYWDRRYGGSGASMTAAESVALANKMWLYEDDTRTFLTPEPYTFPGGPDGGDTLEQTQQHLLRNTGQCAVRNFGTWWMDLGAAGWFDDPRLWEEMKKLETLDELFIKTPIAFKPEIATFVDESSFLAVAQDGHVMTGPTTYSVREPLGRTGAPYGQYLLDDFIAGKTNAKLNVFLAAWQLSKSQREAIRKRTGESEGVDIWSFAPGYLDPESGGSLETMSEILPFRFVRVDAEATGQSFQAWAEPTEAGRNLGLTRGFGVNTPVQPLFAVSDAKPNEVLAAWSDGSAAVVMRTVSPKKSVLFVGAPGLTSELLRLAARRAGVHLFTQEDCNIYANGSALVIHASATGMQNIDFGREAKITDLLDGSDLGTHRLLHLDMKLGETRILNFE